MNKAHLTGFGLVGLVAALAFLLSPVIPGANEILLGLLLGVVLGNLVQLPDHFRIGVNWLRQDGLNIAIIFLGFGLSFSHISALGWPMLILLVVVVFGMLLFTFVLAHIFRCKTSTGWLVGFGTAICGSAAIAALSGSVSEDKEDAGIAIAVVNILGLIGMLALPAMLLIMPGTMAQHAAILGGTLHAVGNVAGAGYSLSDELGDLALTIKLGRVALLAPGLVLFNLLVNKSVSLRDKLKLPYYIWGFILAISVVSFLPVPEVVLGTLQTTGKILLTLAMTAIGLGISIRKLFFTGRVALGFGVIVFIVQVLLVAGLAYWMIKV
jgi:uncharacterized integral membrane protein (TIGR00698 family)